MSKVKCYTSFTFTYLSRALILVRSLRLAHPDWEIWGLMVDSCPPLSDFENELSEFDHIIYADELGFKDFNQWMFKHDIVEACTGVKGRMMTYLLEQGAEKVIYLDPDIAVFHPLDEIEKGLDHASIILTPHQVTPNLTQAAVRDNERTSLQYGIYNLGFAAVRNDEDGLAYARWWEEQLYHACYDDVPNGLFTDQKWCDMVPALFANVKVERDPGMNVASWNLSRRTIEIGRDGRILVNGSPLKFYHFTKINSAGDVMTDKYAKDNTEVYEVWNWYKRTLDGIKMDPVPKGYWHYGRFDNGVVIPRGARLIYRDRKDLFEAFPNPFKTRGDSYYQWLTAEHGVELKLS